MNETNEALKHHVLPANLDFFDHFIILSNYRVSTKIHREWTKVRRVYTKIIQKTRTFKPCLDERLTVFARKHTVSAQEFCREWTKVDRVYTLKTPCEHENEKPFISSFYQKSEPFLRRMYVSILFNLNSLLTTTYRVLQILNNRVSTKANEGRVHGI